MDGWAKPKRIAEYAGVCDRTLRSWLQLGLKHVRLPSGTILIRYEDVDEFLLRYAADESEAVHGIVDDILAAVGGR